MYKNLICSFCFLFFFSCSSGKKEHTIRIAATGVPHAEMLQHIKPDLAKQGIDLEIVVISDYNVPNRALADGSVEANFFQHTPFLQEQIAEFNYPLVVLTPVHIEPMGIYSKKIDNLNELKNGAIISLPNDPTNEARALLLLQQQHLIALKDPTNLKATVGDIAYNPHNFTFHEVDAALLPRTLEDVDVAVINTNFAMQAGLSPLKDALALEGEKSPFVNVIVIRKDELSNPDIEALKCTITTDDMRAWIMEKYKGAIIPEFSHAQDCKR